MNLIPRKRNIIEKDKYEEVKIQDSSLLDNFYRIGVLKATLMKKEIKPWQKRS